MDPELIAQKREALLKQAAQFDERRVQLEKAHSDCVINIQRISGAIGLLNEMEAENKKPADDAAPESADSDGTQEAL